MQLDETRIEIRERNYADILDLALQVIRRHPLAWVCWSSAGALPFILLNTWIFGLFDITELYDEQDYGQLISYGMWVGLLMTIQMPVAAMPLTVFLGQALFVERPSPWLVLRRSLASLPQILLLQVLVRAVLCTFCLLAFLPFAMWPYLSEVILLERNPLFARRRGIMTTVKRTANLHQRQFGELFGRWLATLVLAPLLILALYGGVRLLWSLLTGQLSTNMYTDIGILQIAAWIVVSYFNVVWFLAYLDLRIRTEGWEIELLLRAEGQRLVRQLA
ncbi:MAG: hypothetical protein K1X74_03665 [Pirellulales bacterium]|nr:hypothetical protein [Pirellulales bacterium]